MKENLKTICILMAVFLMTCCSSVSETEKKFNEDDIAQYAACVNELAVQNHISTFLWDCSVHMDRNTLSIKFPSYIDAIINAYPKIDEPGNTGDDTVFEEELAFDTVNNFRAGWNLGNTLDSTSYNEMENAKGNKGWILLYGEKDENGNYLTSDWETAWGQPETNQQIADFILDAGFNAIRIPVTWAEHFDENNNVDAQWMARVKETVDYFYNRGVYCIVNAHHDGGADGWIEATKESYEKYSGRFEKLWTQIANTFIDYDERLLFESMNEVLDDKNNWNEPTISASNWINKYNQLFVDSVRATGGNNIKRNLVVMTYSGGGAAGNFKNFVVPEDTVKNHIILEIHNYDPTAFTWTTATWTKMTAKWNPAIHEKILKDEFAVYKTYSEKLGVPIIIGEYNADPKYYSDYD